MSNRPEASHVLKTTPDEAQEIAHALKGLAQSYAKAGMARHATRAEDDNQWWMARSISLAQTDP